MSLEMTAVTFDGTHAAEQELSALRTARNDPWLIEVAVLEHHASGRYSVKATSADYGEEDHVRAGMAIGAGTGLLLAMIGGPLGILLWTAVGAVAGGAFGSAGRPGAFDPVVEQVKDALPRSTSALILVAERPTAEELISAVGAKSRKVLRQPLTDEQVGQLTQAAVRS
jgi:uncharacterized membrane protein